MMSTMIMSTKVNHVGDASSVASIALSSSECVGIDVLGFNCCEQPSSALLNYSWLSIMQPGACETG
jgi:hypothetical protein